MMESFYSNIRKLPGTLIYLLLSLILMYIAWEVLSNLFDWEGTLRQVVGYIPSNLNNYWPILVIALLFAGVFLTKPFNLIAWFILLVMATSFFAPFLDRTGGWIDRVFNHGDWSEPSDYVRTIKNGTVTMRPGVVENFYVVGEVTLINPNPYTCLGIGPENTFWIVPARFASGDENPRRNTISSKSGEVEMAFVRVKPASECSSRPM